MGSASLSTEFMEKISLLFRIENFLAIGSVLIPFWSRRYTEQIQGSAGTQRDLVDSSREWINQLKEPSYNPPAKDMNDLPVPFQLLTVQKIRSYRVKRKMEFCFRKPKA